MMGTKKFMQYFEEKAGSYPAPFLRRDGSGSLDIAKAGIEKLQMRMINCITSSKGKEYLIIPIGYTTHRFNVLFLSGNYKPELRFFRRRFLKLSFGWLQNPITPVGLDDLSLYIYHKYKTIFITNILAGITKIELPISNKVIQSYTQAGIYDVEYAY